MVKQRTPSRTAQRVRVCPLQHPLDSLPARLAELVERLHRRIVTLLTRVVHGSSARDVTVVLVCPTLAEHRAHVGAIADGCPVQRGAH